MVSFKRQVYRGTILSFTILSFVVDFDWAYNTEMELRNSRSIIFKFEPWK